MTDRWGREVVYALAEGLTLCEACQLWFVPHVHDQRYCSARCRNRVRMRRARAANSDSAA